MISKILMMDVCQEVQLLVLSEIRDSKATNMDYQKKLLSSSKSSKRFSLIKSTKLRMRSRKWKKKRISKYISNYSIKFGIYFLKRKNHLFPKMR